MNPSTTHGLSRRQFVASASLSFAAISLLVPAHLRAANPEAGVVNTMRKDAATAKVTVEHLRDNVTVLFGAGGNIGVLHGRDGKLLVDTGIAKGNVLAALDGIGQSPVRYAVNTHWHFDHTDGNGWLHDAGATIVAHENTRKRLSTATRVEAWDFTFPPSPRGALPTMALRGATTLHFNDTAVMVEPYGPAHTDTDVRVTFADAEVVQLGDTWWNGHYPFIDYSTGGSIDGMIRAAGENVAAVTDKTLAIPGHGPVGGKAELAEYRDLLRSVRDAVAALKRQGRSADEAVAMKPTARYDAKWGTFVIGPAAFTRLVYAGV